LKTTTKNSSCFTRQKGKEKEINLAGVGVDDQIQSQLLSPFFQPTPFGGPWWYLLTGRICGSVD